MATIFSVISPSFNQGKYIEDAIKSVLSQAGEFYIDYQIIDGGSTDQTEEVVEKYQKLLKQNCSSTKVGELDYHVKPKAGFEFHKCSGISFRWLSEPDDGFAQAINRGIDSTVGDIFVYLNTDDMFESNAFENVSKAFELGIDVVYGEAFRRDSANNILELYPTQDVNKHDLGSECFISQPSCFVRMDAVKRAGGFNQRIPNSIDYEYWLRLQKQGAKFKHIDQVLSSTRVYQDTKSLRNADDVALEAFAIQQHYAGKINYAKLGELVMGRTWWVRYGIALLRSKKGIMQWLMGLATRVYAWRSRKLINQRIAQYFN